MSLSRRDRWTESVRQPKLLLSYSNVLKDALSITSSREIRCDCGVRNEGERHLAVGENVTTEYAGNHAWPWMASIVNVSVTDDPVAYCGASLINTQYIMTAAHCIPDMQTTGLGNFRVRTLSIFYVINLTLSSHCTLILGLPWNKLYYSGLGRRVP